MHMWWRACTQEHNKIGDPEIEHNKIGDPEIMVVDHLVMR